MKRKPSMHDLDTMARTIFGEARNQTDIGKLAVANVIINRWQSNKWFGKDTIEKTCTMPRQFSCWNGGDKNFQALIKTGLDDVEFLNCYFVGVKALLNFYERAADVTKGATHYKVINHPASWANGKKPCVTIGDHEFYNDID